MKRINENPEELNKSFLKKWENLKIYPTINRDEGKRKVKVNRNTWIYTRFETDQEAIENYNRVHGIINQ